MRRFLSLVFLALATPGLAQTINSGAGPISVTPVVTGLDTPWGFDFLPDGSLLITQRDGTLLHVSEGLSQEVSGVPAVAARGQGGLLGPVDIRGSHFA